MLVGLYIFAANHQQKPVGVAAIFVPVAMALWLGRRSLRSLGPWIPVIALLGGLYGFITNSEQKLVDMPPVLCAAILLVAELRSPVLPTEGQVFQMPVWWNRCFAFVCVVLGTVGLAQGIARDRVQSIGPQRFFEYEERHTLTGGFFDGLHCGDIFDEVLKEVAEVLRREPSSTVWFGPRMQWGYAAFNKPSPLHQPGIWDRSDVAPGRKTWISVLIISCKAGGRWSFFSKTTPPTTPRTRCGACCSNTTSINPFRC